MLAITRKQKIKDIVLEKKCVTVNELAKEFSVTEETIRRDLKSLEEEGILIRTHGGAFIQTGVENLIDVDIRSTVYTESKEIIAKKCCEMINNGDAIFLDNSTTAYFIAKVIMNKRITLVTNSLNIINLLVDKENIRLIAIGGLYSKPEKAFYGIAASKALREYYVDSAFISCRSLSIENGITESNDKWAEMRCTAIERSKNTYIVADYTKFEQTSFMKICGFDSITGIITDRKLSETWHEAMTKYNISIIECEDLSSNDIKKGIK